MHRNLDRRVETLVGVTDAAQQAELRNLVSMAMDERISSWWLGPDGTWARHQFDDSGDRLADIQDLLIRSRRSRATEA
jgi:polyphosphate kinase